MTIGSVSEECWGEGGGGGGGGEREDGALFKSVSELFKILDLYIVIDSL